MCEEATVFDSSMVRHKSRALMNQRTGSHLLRSTFFRFLGVMVLLPHPFAVGNASEDVYFGLLAARRSKKRLLIIAPIQLPGFLRLPLLDFSIIDVQSEFLICRPLNRWLLPLRWIVTIYFGLWRALSEVRQVRFGLDGFPDIKTLPNAGQDRFFTPTYRPSTFSWTDVTSLSWESQFASPIGVSLPRKTVLEGRKALRGMGVPDDSWFVCVHVREAGFWRDDLALRNADIMNYIPMFKEIVSAGGHVVRMGDVTMTPLPREPNVHDYALTSLRSAAVDAYLLKNCRYFIGMQSGLLDTAMLYDRPRLITNSYSPFDGNAFRANDRAIYRTFVDSQGKLIDAVDLLIDWDEEVEFVYPFPDVGISMRENTQEELVKAHRQFTLALSQGFPEEANDPREHRFQSKSRLLIAEYGLRMTPEETCAMRFRRAAQLTSGMTSRMYNLQPQR